jgi:hypothetical protein
VIDASERLSFTVAPGHRSSGGGDDLAIVGMRRGRHGEGWLCGPHDDRDGQYDEQTSAATIHGILLDTTSLAITLAAVLAMSMPA